MLIRLSMFQLHPEQGYVLHLAEQLGIEARLVHHPRETSTCAEKAALLQETYPQDGWTRERVVKALYFTIDKAMYGFVFPDLGGVVDPRAVRTVFARTGIIVMDAKHGPRPSDFAIQSGLAKCSPPPLSMEYGTCTPFPLESEASTLRGMYIQAYASLDQQVIDVSVGGHGPEAHTASFHLPYQAIYDILRQQFADKIHRTNFLYVKQKTRTSGMVPEKRE